MIVVIPTTLKVNAAEMPPPLDRLIFIMRF